MVEDSAEKLDKQWEKMDNLGFAGEYGSNKPKVTEDLVKARDGDGDGESSLGISQTSVKPLSPYLMPLTTSEQRQVSDDRLQPNGKYRKFRGRRGGVNSPIDGSSGMREINRTAMQGVKSRR